MPPSSIETRSTCSADCSISFLPTSVEPVKDSLRVRGSFSSGSITCAGVACAVITFSTPAGRPASCEDLGERQHRERRLLGGLDDHRAARGDRRCQLAGAHRRREVPGRHEDAGPDRLAHRQDAALAGRVDHVAAMDPHRLLGEPAEELGRIGDLRARLGHRLAHLERHQQRQLVGLLDDRLIGPAQYLATLAGRVRGPLGLFAGRGRQSAAIASSGEASATSISFSPVAGSSTPRRAAPGGRAPLPADNRSVGTASSTACSRAAPVIVQPSGLTLRYPNSNSWDLPSSTATGCALACSTRGRWPSSAQPITAPSGAPRTLAARLRVPRPRLAGRSSCSPGHRAARGASTLVIEGAGLRPRRRHEPGRRPRLRPARLQLQRRSSPTTTRAPPSARLPPKPSSGS